MILLLFSRCTHLRLWHGAGRNCFSFGGKESHGSAIRPTPRFNLAALFALPSLMGIGVLLKRMQSVLTMLDSAIFL